MDFLQNNWQWLTLVAIPAAAPVVTIGVNKFGTPGQQAAWNSVRKVYRRVFGLGAPK